MNRGRQKGEISHMRSINSCDGIFLYETIVICVFNIFSKTQNSRHFRQKTKAMAQYRNFYRFKFRFSPPKAVQILISPSRMLAVNYVGALEKIRNGEVRAQLFRSSVVNF